MVCEEFIKNMERKLGRKLNPQERKKIEEKMHHSEISEDKREEEMVCA